MSTSKFELIIKNDSHGKEVELDEMSLETAKSFKVFLDSLINIVDNMPAENKAGVSIQIKKGSAYLAIEGPENNIQSFENNFDKVIKNEARDKDLVHQWRNIQEVISANGITYEVNFVYTKKEKRSVLETFKTSKPFKVKQKRNASEFTLSFLSGKLIAIGGVNPNFHLLNSDLESIIQCDETSAKRINSFLYNEILVTAWCKKVPGGKPYYIFNDIYTNLNQFVSFRDFFQKFHYKSDNQEFEALHDFTKSIISDGNLGLLAKFLRLFNHNSVETATLKSLLVLTKSFKREPEIKDIRNSLMEIIEKKMGKKLN